MTGDKHYRIIVSHDMYQRLEPLLTRGTDPSVHPKELVGIPVISAPTWALPEDCDMVMLPKTKVDEWASLPRKLTLGLQKHKLL